MDLRQDLRLKLATKLSPLQIQTIKLLEATTMEIEARIRKELEDNPVLDDQPAQKEDDEGTEEESRKNVSLSGYSSEDDIPSYKLYVNNRGKDEKPQYNTFSVKESFQQSLQRQLGFTNLDERRKNLAKFIIGSLSSDGYLRRELDALVDDISFRLGIETSEEELESLLELIQQFEPAGIGARSLQECLTLQLESKITLEKTKAEELRDAKGLKYKQLALDMLYDHFDLFTKKHYDKICSRMDISQDDLKEIIAQILKLNPRPGGQIDDSYSDQSQQVVPDFILEEEEGVLTVTMPKFNIPELRVNKRYRNYLDKANVPTSNAEKEAASFVKRKLDSARWFIEAVKQRQNTLQKTMEAIVELQHNYMLDGDETKLKPMTLKDVADITGFDVSTISRVVNSKYVQTNFGIFSLKSFFSEGVVNNSGEEVSTREIKKLVQDSVDAENKAKPLTDDELSEILDKHGFSIARRTVAKYREQMGIPVARLRKQL